MKILVICQYYSPEPFRIADICEALVKDGHEVDVVTSLPNYPMGKIYDGYKGGAHKDEVINGVNVHRTFTIARRTGPVFRLLNYYAYSIAATLYVSRLKKEYDAVFVYQLSPVMMAEAALKFKKLHGKRVVLYCLDLWPESLVTGGICKGSFVYKFFEKVSKKIYCNVDKLFVSSKTFSMHLSEKYGMSEEDITYLPQYAEDIFTPAGGEKGDKFTLTFAGNIGTAQSLDTLLEAAEILKDENICFNIVGDGTDLQRIKALSESKGLTNITFHGRKPVEEMPGIYAASDACIVTLVNDPVLSMTLPGKVQSYMACGKPVVGAISGEGARVIKDAGCGFCAPAEDGKALAECIREMYNADLTALGNNAHQYYNRYFRKDLFISKIIEELKK